jgi:hypothetical protein
MPSATETWLYTTLGVDSAIPRRLFPIRKIPLELPYFPYQTNEKWFNTREEMCFHASLFTEASKTSIPLRPLFSFQLAFRVFDWSLFSPLPSSCRTTSSSCIGGLDQPFPN